jgi:outer membrane protein assembly factor BamB
VKLTCFLPAFLAWAAIAVAARAADWPQWGGAPARNNAPQDDIRDLPAQWNVGQFDPQSERWLKQSTSNIRWAARLGSHTYGTPVVAGGRVFCATNNGAGWLKQYPPTIDLGCLLAFRQSDGRFDWQLSCRKLAAGDALDFAKQGICSVPLVEDKRLWIVTNRCELVCVDVEGPAGGNVQAAGQVEPGSSAREAKVLWRLDMIGRLGVAPRNMSSCSVTATGDLLLLITANGADESKKKVLAPEAPSFIAVDKHSGKVVWADNSPGANILLGQWSSPAFAVIGGLPQAVFPGGDGWLYSFHLKPGGKPELLWKFDCNPKRSVWKGQGQGDRGILVGTPVIHQGRVYIATGDDPEFGGESPGHLWCIDAGKRGDVSPELVFDKQGRPVPTRSADISPSEARARRLRAADPVAGDVVRPNPNSAAVWHYVGAAAAGDDKADFKQTMHRTIGMAAIRDDLLVIADLKGLVHCLDTRTGKVRWTYDMMSSVWGSPLIADGKIYLGDEDGDVRVFALSPQFKLLAENSMGSAVYTTPVAAGNVLYISSRTYLFAIAAEK